MAGGKSFLGGVGFKEEQTFGTPVAVDTWLPVLSESMSVDEQLHKDDTIYGDSELVEIVPGLRKAAGSLSLNALGTAAFGWLLKWATRAMASAALGGSHVSAPGVSVSTGGSLAAGTYKYKTTRIVQHTASGKLFHTNPSAESSGAATSGAALQVDLTWTNGDDANIPAGFTAWGTGIWRTAAGGGANTEKILAFVSGSSTTTYTDTGAISLGTATPPATVYFHRFKPGSGELKPFTLEVVKDNTKSERYEGCRVNSLQFSVKPGEPVGVTAELMAQDMSEIASSTPAFTVLKPFMGYQTYAYIQAAGASLIQSVLVAALEMTLANGLEPEYVLDGTRVPSNIFSKRRDVTGSMDLIFPNTTEMAHVLANDAMSFFYSLNGPPTTAASRAIIGSDTVDSWPHMLVFDIPEAFYRSHAANLSGQSKVHQKLPFEAKKNSTAGYALEMRLASTASGFPDA